MAGLVKKYKTPIIIFCLLSVIVLLLTLILRWGLFVTVYFHVNYDSNEFYIEKRLYYESKNDSDLSETLDSKGIKFPSIVFRIQAYGYKEKAFYIGMHALKVWDTYQTDIVEREIVVEGLERKAGVFVCDILSRESMLSYARVWLIPHTAEAGFDLAALYEFDMEFSADIPFRRKDVLFETGFRLENEDEALQTVMRWLLLLDESNLRFDYVTIMYDGIDRIVYDRFETDYDNLQLIRIMSKTLP